jgi:hypothetical protein
MNYSHSGTAGTSPRADHRMLASVLLYCSRGQRTACSIERVHVFLLLYYLAVYEPFPLSIYKRTLRMSRYYSKRTVCHKYFEHTDNVRI